MSQKTPNSSPAPLFAWPTPTAAPGPPALSVVIPMYNEEGGAAALIAEIAGALAGVSHEIVAVDDASRDGTAAALLGARERHAALRILRHAANAGQSRAIRTGVLAARAAVIVTLDGDGQNDPADIVALYAQLVRPGAPTGLAMVAGERRRRQDSAAKRIGSRIANNVRSRLLRDGAADTGCGLKAFYRVAYLRLPAFDHMHRYLPALMRREGYLVEFVGVNHRPREHGRSKYTNLGRLAVAFRDLLGVMWLNSRARSPNEISEL
jgi:dolichol-phosphate mannosyltransferase